MTGRLGPGDVDAFLLGATLLGSGGGGEAGVWAHRVRAALPEAGIELLSLTEARDRGLDTVAAVGMIGATSVLVEKLPHGGEIAEAVAASRHWNGVPVDALMPVEAAGLNAALAVAAAVELGLPLLDVDLMGRALPRFDQLSLLAAGSGLIRSAALAETGGQVLVLDHSTPSMLERAVRAYVSVAGGWAGASFGPVAVDELEGRSCEGTLGRAISLGRALEAASRDGVGAPAEVAEALGGLLLGTGRVVDVARGPVRHPNRGRFAVAGRTGPVLRIEAENEYLLVLADGEPVVSCPELILVLDRRTARPIAVDRLRLGDDVQVLALPGPSWWWEEPERLTSVAPRAFGIDLDPVRLSGPRSRSAEAAAAAGLGETMPGEPDAGMMRLSHALALPEWSEVRVLGGPDPGSGAELSGVVVMATVRQAVSALDSSLVVVAEDVDRDDWHLDTLIRRVSAAAGGGLMIGGETTLPTASALVAQRLGVTVLGALDPWAAAVALQTHLALPELAAARLLADASTACRNAAAGVDAVIAQTAAALKRGVWLVDSAGHVVAGPPPSWESESAISAVLNHVVTPAAKLVHLPVQTDDPRGAHLVMERGDEDRTETLLTVLRLVAEAVSARLARQRLSAERDARRRVSLLSELLRSGGRLAPETPMRLLDLSWTVDGWHLGIRIDVPPAADPLALRPDVLHAFAEAGVPAQVVEQGSGWAAWSTFSLAPTAVERQSRSTAIRRAQWRLRSALPSVMGVGSLQSGPEGLVRSLGEATEAAKIAVSRTAGGYVVQFDRLGLSRLLMAWTQTDTFAPAAAPLLVPLQDQPGELVATLSAYLDAESSVSDTAAVLGVHRNTVAARVSRAVELLGVDLADPDERMAIQLACRAVLARR